jgi:hypothetical protein
MNKIKIEAKDKKRKLYTMSKIKERKNEKIHTIIKF